MHPGGVLGLELYGKVAYIDLSNPAMCSSYLSFHGPFGEVLCSYQRSGNYDAILTFQLTFISWPSPPMDNSFYYNDGNPSKDDFRCDTSRMATRIAVCYFSDISSSNVIGQVYSSHPF